MCWPPSEEPRAWKKKCSLPSPASLRFCLDLGLFFLNRVPSLFDLQSALQCKFQCYYHISFFQYFCHICKCKLGPHSRHIS
jgi:hypothetical protein